jgi:hypothetical protein
MSLNPGETCSTAANVPAPSVPFPLTGTFNYEPSTGGSCDTTPNNVAWFRYTPASTGWYDVYLANNTGTTAYARVAIFETAACAPRGPEVKCVLDDTKKTVSALTYLEAATEYLIMFYTNGETYTMVDPSITITPTGPPPPATVCATAADLTGQSFPYSLVGDFQDDATGGSCDTAATNIVWYLFTPATSATYTIDAVNATVMNSYSRLAVFETASCVPYGAEVGCVTASDTLITLSVPLTAGTTYLILFYTDGPTWQMLNPSITIT